MINTMKLGNKLSSVAFKVTILVTFMVISLLALLNYLVIDQSQRAFSDVVGNAQINGAGRGRQMPSQNEPLDIIRYESDGARRRKPLDIQFREQFQTSLLWVGAVAVLTSAIIGLITSRFMTTPIKQLRSGINHLRQNHYQLLLAPTGTQEFDQVIAEFNLMAQELQKIEQLRKDMLADTSHELKTPLTSLTGQLEGVRDGVLTMDKKRAELLLGQVHRLTDVVERLQEFSRLRGAALSPDMKTITLRPLVEELVSAWNKRASDEGIKLVIDIPNNYKLQAYKVLLQQILNNLIENCIKYSRAAKLLITVEEKQLILADDGVGIPIKEQSLVFERFYRVEKSRNRKTGGLGLGLAIVKELVQAQGWDIKLSFNNPEKKQGSKFVIRYN